MPRYLFTFLTFLVLAACADQDLGSAEKRIDAGEYRAVAKSFSQAQLSVREACILDKALRRWQQAHDVGLEDAEPSQELEHKTLVVLQQAARRKTADISVFLALYWHESTFETFRLDEPSSVSWVVPRDRNGNAAVDAKGHPRKVRIEEFSGPDPAKVKRLESYFSRAKALGPDNDEVLYISALHEKNSEKKYALLERSFERGGEAHFKVALLDKLATTAASIGRSADARRWKLLLDEQLKQPKRFDVKLYLARKTRLNRR